MKLTPLNTKELAGKSWKRYETYAFAARTHLCPMVLAELGQATTSVPLAFTRQDSQVELVGVMSLRVGDNRMIGANGRWMGTYVPAAFRSYPFRLARVAGKDEHVLCMDSESGLILDDTSGEAFFTEEGKLAPGMTEIMNFLTAMERNRAQTRTALDALDAAGVLTPWPVGWQQAGTGVKVDGLFCIDEKALGALDDAAFCKLRRANALPLAYAQIFSSRLMVTMVQLTRDALNSAARSGGSTGELTPATLQALGMATDDGLIHFD